MHSATGRRVSNASTFPGDGSVGHKKHVGVSGREQCSGHEAWASKHLSPACVRMEHAEVYPEVKGEVVSVASFGESSPILVFLYRSDLHLS